MLCEAAGRGQDSIPCKVICHQSRHIAPRITRQILCQTTRHIARRITFYITRQITVQRTLQITRNITRQIHRQTTRHIARQIFMIIISHGFVGTAAINYQVAFTFSRKANLRLSLQHFYIYFKVNSLLVLYRKGALQRCFAPL